MTENRLEVVKKEVRSLLISYQKGLSLEEFRKAYRGVLGVRLPSREFGYTSDIDFLHSIPDVVYIQVDNSGTYKLHGIADENTVHIKKLVEKQRTTKPKNKPVIPKKIVTPGSRCSYTSSVRCRPFVPALLRAEIIQVVKQYPDGIGYIALGVAYRNIYKKVLNLEWLSSDQQERLGKLANAVPELEVKGVNELEKLFLADDKCSSDYNGYASDSAVSGTYSKLQNLREITENSSANPNATQLSAEKFLNLSTVSDNVKNNIEKVLKRYPQGLLAVHFPILYEKITKQAFDLHEMGFNNLLDLVDALPDIFFRAESPESSKDWVLFHVDNSSNASNLGPRLTKSCQNDTDVHKSTHYVSNAHPVADIAPPDLEYIQPELPENAKDMFIPVFVSAFINPSLFWFQLQTCEAIESLSRLEDEMQFFYNTQPRYKFQMDDADILIGASCVTFCPKDKHWYRAIISSLPHVEYINVLYVDYGSWEKVHRSMLCYLKYNFIRFPAHAFKAKLAAIKPLSKKGVWEIGAQRRFLQLCNKSSVMAKIDSLENQTFSVFLCDLSDDAEIHVNDTLFLEGYAEQCLMNGRTGALSPVNQQDSEHVYKLNSPPTSRLKDKGVASPLTLKHEHSPVSILNAIEKLNSQSNKNGFQKCSGSRKPIKRILLGDGYRIHLLALKNEAFVSGDELCNLLWKGKKADALAFKLEFKEVRIPPIYIEKSDFPEIFTECERHLVYGFDPSLKDYTVNLYPLTHIVKILNIFGHPSVEVRKTILEEIKNFDPSDSTWMEMNENNNPQVQHQDKFQSLCLYDLKIMWESLHCKRLKLQVNSAKIESGSLSAQLKNIELNQSLISKRIEELEAICDTYS